VLDEPLLQLLEVDCEGALPDLLRVFLDESRSRLARIDGLLRGDRRSGELAREAHTLKGAAVTFGCAALGAAARDLELAATAGRTDLDRLMQEVNAAHVAAADALERRYPGLARAQPASAHS
jgi:HPt (histidine-containing phosphotransfer) domain-containing protein